MSDTKRNCSICKYGYMNNGSGEICPKNDCVDYSLFEPAIPDKPAQPEAVKPDDAYCGNCEYYRLGDIAEECKTCTVLSMNDRSKHHSNWKPKPEPSALAKEQGQGDVDESLATIICKNMPNCNTDRRKKLHCCGVMNKGWCDAVMYIHNGLHDRESKLREKIVAEFLAELKTHRQDDHFAGNTGFVDWQDIEKVAEEVNNGH